MTKSGKLLLLFGVLFYAALYIFRLAYGGWHDSMWVQLVLGTLLFFGGLIKERRALLEFFAMRTTAQGLNMGAILLIAIAGLTCLNILAVRYDKKFDWTSDKLNSLSDQSQKAARAIRTETKLVLLYRNDNQSGDNVQKSIKDLATMYSVLNSQIRFSSFNAVVDPTTARQFDYTSGPFAFFAVQGERKLKIDQPSEEGVTRALIKLGRTQKKVLYFTMGHGERDLDAKDPDGLSFLKDELSVTYDVRALTLYQSGNKVPGDAAAVAIVRPNQQFLESELKALREYVQLSKGRLLIAIDPGMKHNLAGLTHVFGVEFANDFVLDLRSQVVQAGPATVLGTNFPTVSDITKAFGEGSFAVFDIASSLKRAGDAPKEAKIEPLIATDQRTMSTIELGQVQFKPNGPHTLAMVATSGPSEVIVFGDSDLLSNRLVQSNLNNDLILNSVADLTNDKDLISIRPRAAKATRLDMTRQTYNVFVFLFLIPLPFLLFFGGGFMWYRRRTA